MTRAGTLLMMLFALGSVRASNVRAQTASVHGVARSIDGEAPVSFALVRLVPADTSVPPREKPPEGITSVDGRYRFGGVAAGRYRVQLLRIGFRPTLSDAIQVADGETAQLLLRVLSVPLTLTPVAVTADVCIPTAELPQRADVHALWQQARDGASIRMALMTRYRYHVLQREVSYEVRDAGPTPPYTLDQPYVNEPKNALRFAAQRRARWRSSGFYAPNDGWGVPSELDILHDEFLRTHCLLASVERGDGEIGLRFLPLRVRRDFLDVRGTIWLDATTFLTRRIALEYVDGEDSRGTLRFDFGDVAVAGGMLRMPEGGAFAVRSSRKNPLKRAEGKLTYTYTEFVEVPPPA